MEQKTLHTGLFTSRACDILAALLSEYSSVDCYSIRNAVVRQNCDGEVTISNTYDRYNSLFDIWHNSTNSEIKTYIANSLKELVCRLTHTFSYEPYDKGWFKNSKINIPKIIYQKINDYMTTVDVEVRCTVGEAYFIYQALLENANLRKCGTRKLYKDIVGHRKDPIATEMEIARREELAKIHKKYADLAHEKCMKNSRELFDMSRKDYIDIAGMMKEIDKLNSRCKVSNS